MRKILIFLPYYFPGYMSGGIARTIKNTTEWLADEFEFLIVTTDRDLGSDIPYSNVLCGEWQQVGKAKVKYLKPSELNCKTIAALINSTSHNLLQLNSFFDTIFTFKILLLKRFNKINTRKILMSPRGEFVDGPLRLKYFKKKIYIETLKLFGFYENLYWHASSPHEAEGIIDALHVSQNKIFSAIDLPIKNLSMVAGTGPQDKNLRVVFISRLTREKNLDGALRILSKVSQPLSFDIIGPKEDLDYWSECEALLLHIPHYVTVRYIGSISPEEVFDYLSNYDVFLFPTRGENYGHVIAESLSVGTRVLISKETPWRDLECDGLGWDFDINDDLAFVNILDNLAMQTAQDRFDLRKRVVDAAAIRLFNPESLENNRLVYSL